MTRRPWLPLVLWLAGCGLIGTESGNPSRDRSPGAGAQMNGGGPAGNFGNPTQQPSAGMQAGGGTGAAGMASGPGCTGGDGGGVVRGACAFDAGVQPADAGSLPDDDAGVDDEDGGSGGQ